MDKILIGIKSCEINSERQNACRNTWINTLDKDQYLPLFLVGRKGTPSEIIGDVLYLDCNDGYDKLIEKTTAFIKWYTENSTASHCILCDDDTYINCSIFNTFEEYKPYDYSGSFIYGIEKIPDQRSGYCSGCFYILSNKASNHYLTQYDPSMVSGVFFEDLCTGNLINTDPNLTKFDPHTIHAWSYCTYHPTLMIGHYPHKGMGSLPSFTDSMHKMHDFYNGKGNTTKQGKPFINIKHEIFLDCGSHHLEGLAHFLDQKIINETFEIHTFEANPECRVGDRLKTFKYDLANCTFHQKLVWVSDGAIAFNQENHFKSRSGSPTDGTSYLDGWGSSIAGIGFVHPGYDEPIISESIDFSRFIGELPPDSNIICKLDIEGSEFAVLRKLLHDGTINKISKLYVEFHDRFMSDESSESTNSLVSEIQKLGIEIHPWF